MPEPTQVKHLSSAPLKVRLLASPTIIRQGWKGLPGSNTLAYYENYGQKSFITLALGLIEDRWAQFRDFTSSWLVTNAVKLTTAVIYDRKFFVTLMTGDPIKLEQVY
jgi:hypothetical protein